MSNKKALQLGMNPSTAQGRLVKDILWSLVVETNKHSCIKCGELMNRETFSIEHVKPWLDSDDPVVLFFDISNIAFSHLKCNISDARKVNRYKDDEDKEKRQKESRKRTYQRNFVYCAERRRQQYLKTGS